MLLKVVWVCGCPLQEQWPYCIGEGPSVLKAFNDSALDIVQNWSLLVRVCRGGVAHASKWQKPLKGLCFCDLLMAKCGAHKCERADVHVHHLCVNTHFKVLYVI